MKERYITSLRGFTMLEVLLSVLLASVTLILVYNFYTIADNTSRYAFIQCSMQRQAMQCLEKIIRGTDANRKGIQEAQDITNPATGSSDTQITFVDQDDSSVSRQFYLSGDKVVYLDEDSNTTDLISQGVQSLILSRLQDDVVEITLSLQRTVLGRLVSVNLSSAVKLRNN